MDEQTIAAKSPVRVLEKMISGGLSSGSLGVIMARAGVGKTAFLIQVGLDALLRGDNVLHVAAGQQINHVQAWYDTLLDELACSAGVHAGDSLRAAVAGRRFIQTYADSTVSPRRLEQTVELFVTHMRFEPRLILLDGYDWEAGSAVRTAADLGVFQACAQRLGAALWMSAQTSRRAAARGARIGISPCDAFDELIDVAVFLDPVGHEVNVRIVKDHGRPVISETPLVIHSNTFSLMAHTTERGRALPPTAYTLLSGGAKGAEEAFGICAEEWGLTEVNYTFEGHQTMRSRGLVMLTPAELEQGHVSDAYVQAQMRRTYPDTPLFRRVLQSIWHQVNTAGEVFVVGVVQPDNTVRGGTGWAAELARHWHKPLQVYDQEKNAWFAWTSEKWAEIDPPVISRTTFAGTGTRFLTDAGRNAIRRLFERSFGRPKRLTRAGYSNSSDSSVV